MDKKFIEENFMRMTNQQLADKFKVHKNTIQTFLRKNGLKRVKVNEITDLTGFVIISEFSDYKIRKDGTIIDKNNKIVTITNNSQVEYPNVKFRFNNKNHTRTIHRLLATAFIPNPENLPVVNHKDGNKYNFDISNLEWCTLSYNQLHASNTLGMRGENIGTSVLTEKLVEEICKYINIGLQIPKIKEKLKIINVSDGTLYQIKQNKTWKHITNKYLK